MGMGSKIDKLRRSVIAKKDYYEDELLEQVEGFLEGKGIRLKAIDFIDDGDHIAVRTQDDDYRVLEVNIGDNKTEIIDVTMS